VGTLGSQDLKDMAWEDSRLLPPVPPPPCPPPPVPSPLQAAVWMCIWRADYITSCENTCGQLRNSDKSTCMFGYTYSMIEHDAIMIEALNLCTALITAFRIEWCLKLGPK
jgi:hypothetical protein